MAAAMGSHRAVAVGIAGGLGLALPMTAYLATIPFDGAHEAVAADVLPFAAGAIAGVGLLALSGSLLDARDRRRAPTGADMCAEGFADADPARTHVRSAAPKGVPVINRAIDAMDEEAAWAEIDAMFTDGSPFSCDPARSKDMYQIAFEELQRTAATPGASSPVRPARPDSTAMYAAMASAPATPAASAGVSPADSASASSTAVSDQAAPYAGFAATASTGSSPNAVSAPAGPTVHEDVDAQAARDAAMAALYGPSPLAPASRSAASAAAPQASAAPATSVPVPASEQDVEVPVADYSGHEAMWEAALAILDEPGDVRTSPAITSSVSADHMAALAAGGVATTMHDHVNDMLEQELDRSSSGSVRGATHEFLRVVQGGTASMPRMSAEA